jgi:hypothetical protein
MMVVEEDDDQPVDVSTQVDMTVKGQGQDQGQPGVSHPVCTCSVAASTQTEEVKGACTACGTCIRENPLVTMGRLPAELADVLWVPPETRRVQGRKRPCTQGRVMTAAEEIQKLQEDMEKPKEVAAQKELKKEERETRRVEKMATEAEQKEQRKQEREEKKKEKTAREAEQKEQREQQKLARQIQQEEEKQAKKQQKPQLCEVCERAPRPAGARTPGSTWLYCAFCSAPFHRACLHVDQYVNVHICDKCASQ